MMSWSCSTSITLITIRPRRYWRLRASDSNATPLSRGGAHDGVGRERAADRHRRHARLCVSDAGYVAGWAHDVPDSERREGAARDDPRQNRRPRFARCGAQASRLTGWPGRRVSGHGSVERDGRSRARAIRGDVRCAERRPCRAFHEGHDEAARRDASANDHAHRLRLPTLASDRRRAAYGARRERGVAGAHDDARQAQATPHHGQPRRVECRAEGSAHRMELRRERAPCWRHGLRERRLYAGSLCVAVLSRCARWEGPLRAWHAQGDHRPVGAVRAAPSTLRARCGAILSIATYAAWASAGRPAASRRSPYSSRAGSTGPGEMGRVGMRSSRVAAWAACANAVVVSPVANAIQADAASRWILISGAYRSVASSAL